MTDQTKDGGAAFPATVQGWNDRLSQSQGGMSLRDWFAGHALIGLAGRNWSHVPEDKIIPTWAVSAYGIADAMLAERVKHADATP